jgi:hypothetical protein
MCGRIGKIPYNTGEKNGGKKPIQYIVLRKSFLQIMDISNICECPRILYLNIGHSKISLPLM